MSLMRLFAPTLICAAVATPVAADVTLDSMFEIPADYTVIRR